ncbi:hypothetical protein J437_LFUL011864 [Ladona fulva]|uniref:Cuticular protein n=1 Tax=Ladona fulva TaxID=123851 RepID=A0A8K0KIT6_LADFU|nr:hypothetical protein J437_LFUL011864 [Ladona fulva]
MDLGGDIFQYIKEKKIRKSTFEAVSGSTNMAGTKFLTSLVACLLAYTLADDSGFGDKIPTAARDTRDVSSLTYGGPPPPPTGYGPPGHTGFPPIASQQQQQQHSGGFPPNRGQQQFFQGQQQTGFGQQQTGFGQQQAGFGQQQAGFGQQQGGYGQQPVGSFQGSFNQQHQGGYQDRGKYPPMPYEFAYSVLDAPSGNDYSHRETGDASGRVSGEYRVLLPDGRTQIVTYTATDETGFKAQVTYQGEARPAPQGGFGFGNQGGYRGGSNQGSFQGGVQGGYPGGAQGGFGAGGNQGGYQGAGFGAQKRPSTSYGAPQPYRR